LDQGFLIIDRPPSGEHEVFVRPLGSAARGVRDEALYWFRVEPPFWFTWPGILLQVVGFIGLLTLIWRVYTLRLRRRNRWLEQNVKARTQELDHRNAQLTRALETRSALIATIGHDIITPLRFLARVARSTRQLSRTGVEPAELDRSLEDLGQSAEKLNANASALMDWVKFNPDHITPRLQAVDLGALVRDVVELWQELADRGGIRIDVQVATGIQVHSDPQLLKVILNNLLGNAITHSGTNIGVCITFAKLPDGWELRLADTGAGIDADTLERLQQLLNAPHVSDPARFARGDGQGIGYVIVASMAQLLRASIRIESHAEGTVISLIHREA
jgi:signal transduction histidine kinase